MAPHEPDLCNDDKRNLHVLGIEVFAEGLEEDVKDAILTGASLKEIRDALNKVAEVTFRLYDTLGKRMREETKAIKTV